MEEYGIKNKSINCYLDDENAACSLAKTSVRKFVLDIIPTYPYYSKVLYCAHRWKLFFTRDILLFVH